MERFTKRAEETATKWRVAMEMKCQRSMCGVSRMDSVRDEVVRRRGGLTEKLSDRVDKKFSKWLGHVQRLKEDWL